MVAGLQTLLIIHFAATSQGTSLLYYQIERGRTSNRSGARVASRAGAGQRRVSRAIITSGYRPAHFHLAAGYAADAPTEQRRGEGDGWLQGWLLLAGLYHRWPALPAPALQVNYYWEANRIWQEGVITDFVDNHIM